jgi:hypothetical protein
MRKMKNAHKISRKNINEQDYVEDLRVHFAGNIKTDLSLIKGEKIPDKAWNYVRVSQEGFCSSEVKLHCDSVRESVLLLLV